MDDQPRRKTVRRESAPRPKPKAVEEKKPLKKNGYQFSHERVLEAVSESNGTYTGVARLLGCRSCNTAEKYIRKWPDTSEAFDAIQLKLIDKAEDVMLRNLESERENIRFKAAEFILKHSPLSTWKEQKGLDVELRLISVLEKMVANVDPTK